MSNELKQLMQKIEQLEHEIYITQRQIKECCPLCGYHLDLHTYISASATEPAEYICDCETSKYKHGDEPTYNQLGELGYWVSDSSMEF